MPHLEANKNDALLQRSGQHQRSGGQQRYKTQTDPCSAAIQPTCNTRQQLSRTRPTGAFPGHYFGEIVQIIRRECCSGFVSSLPTSINCSMTPSITLRPSAMCAISRPRKSTVTCTLSLCCKNALAFLILKSMSCCPVFGRNRISLVLVT